MVADCLLRTNHLVKSFPGVQALEDVNLEIARGEVHAVVGENGAGKSTLMRILAGLEQPDAGEVIFKGARVRIGHPHQALRMGVSMIHQELLPFPELSVAENILMGQEPVARCLGWIDRKRLHARAGELLERLGVGLSPKRKMKELSVAEMQTVEIAKALAYRAELIIMDEPTSSISSREVAALFGIIRDLRNRGVAVIYISHKMEEVFQIADTITVLRDGQQVATRPAGGLNEQQLIAWMVGRELAALFPKSTAVLGEEALAVRGLGKAGKFQDVTFALRCGEILGLAGLIGAGRTEVASAIFGLAPADSGQIRIRGRPARITSPREAIRSGIGMMTEDRKQSGLVLTMSVQHNLALGEPSRGMSSWWIDQREERAMAEEQIRAFSIRSRGGSERAELLSGGNQQKLVLAKVLRADPAILILDEPTRGIDINAKAEIYRLISRLAREGRAILLISSELPEILALSDRILVMRQGRIAAELDPRRATPEEIMRHAMPI